MIRDVATKWNSWVPIELNVLMCRIRLGRISTRESLSARGMEIDYILCSVCQSQSESLFHIFVNCLSFKDIRLRIATWWNVDLPVGQIYCVFNPIRKAFNAVVVTTFWSFLRYQNNLFLDQLYLSYQSYFMIFYSLVLCFGFQICVRKLRSDDRVGFMTLV